MGEMGKGKTTMYRKYRRKFTNANVGLKMVWIDVTDDGPHKINTAPFKPVELEVWRKKNRFRGSLSLVDLFELVEEEQLRLSILF